MHQTTELKKKMCEVKTDRIGKSNKHIHNYSCRLQTPLSVINKTTRQKITKNIEEFNDTINNWINSVLTEHKTTAEYKIFLSAHKTYIKINPILGHKKQKNQKETLNNFLY